jgi:sporulation protein YlmC with PRC-barrel domain
MEQVNEGPNVARLSDSELVLEDPAQDVRGRNVYDSSGEEIGTVEDLYVDEAERRVRFLEVGAGGFLGLGEKHFLIPVEAVGEVSDEGVTVSQTREKIVGSPAYDPNVVPESQAQRDIYDYYGLPRLPGATFPGPTA